jgi:hypothetical protein
MVSYKNTYSYALETNLNDFSNFYTKKIKNYKNNNYDIESNINNFIEYINDIDYETKSEGIKYKILDDSTHIIKSKDDIKLVLDISNTNEVLSILKIKLSKKIKAYIKDIYIKQNKEVILTKDKLLNINTKDTHMINKKSGKLNLYIIIELNSLNYFINSSIYILFLFVNNKNKVKYLE